MNYLAFNIIGPLILIIILLRIYFRLRIKKKYTRCSPLLGKVEVVEKYNQEKMLTINGYAQGISIHDPSIVKSYWYKIAQETVRLCKGKNPSHILMLGLGANTITLLIDKLNPKIHKTIVEIDDVIIQACQSFFDLDKLKNLNLIHQDAYKLVTSKQLKQRFDVIIIDIYLGKPPFVDLQSNQPSFVQQLVPYLKKEGSLIFNRPAHISKARDENAEFVKFLKNLFKKVVVFDIKDPRGFRNHVIAATQAL